MKIIFAIAVLAMCILSHPPLNAQDRIIAAEMPPMAYSQDGEAHGFAVDIVKELAIRLKINQAIEVMPLARALVTAQTAQNVLLISIARIPERENLLRWIAEIQTEPLVIFAKSESKFDIFNLEGMKNLRVGVLRNSASEHTAKRLGFQMIEVSSADITSAKKLLADRIDIWLTGLDFAMLTLDRTNLERSSIRQGAVVGSINLYLAGSLQMLDVTVEKWNSALNKLIADGSYRKIQKKHKFVNFSNDIKIP